MRILLTIFTSFSLFLCSGQTGKIKGIIIDTTGLLKDNPVRISLAKDNIEIADCFAAGDGKFVFRDIVSGNYKLIVSRIGYRSEEHENIVLSPAQELELNINYPAPAYFIIPTMVNLNVLKILQIKLYE